MACCGKRQRVVSPEKPIVLGEPNDEPPVRGRVTIAMNGLRAGDQGWFTGSNLATFVAQALIVLG